MKYVDDILYFCGCGCLIAAAWMHNVMAGLIVTGAALIVTSIIWARSRH